MSGKQWLSTYALIVLVIIFVVFLLSGCDDRDNRLESQEVKLKDGRTVQCVREVGIDTRMTCEWDGAK